MKTIIRHGGLVAGFAIAALATVGCGSSSAVSRVTSRATSDPVPEHRFENFDPSLFAATSTTIDNRYLPLAPGTEYVYEGSDLQDGKRVPHRVDFIVTDLTKVVDGVRTVVIWDRDFTRDDLEEAELTFFAQDTTGNVWHLGQYSEIYEGDELAGARGFLVGYLDGAHAGIMMPAQPRLGTPSYSEGYAPPPISWTDRAIVDQVDKKTKVGAGSYSNVMVTREYSENKADGVQTKFYAPGVGVVRVGFLGNDPEGETLELVKVVHLDAAGLAKARAEALEVDTRATMYGRTPPLVQKDASA